VINSFKLRARRVGGRLNRAVVNRGRAGARAALADDLGPLTVRLDQLSFFGGLLILRGYAANSAKAVCGVSFTIGDRSYRTKFDHPSKGGFFFHETVPFDAGSFEAPRLVIAYGDGSQEVIGDLVGRELSLEAGHQLFGKFLQRIGALPPGAMLEIGSRARSGITRRGFVPKGWAYEGLDIVAGENVSVVGDAHQMSGQLAAGHFNAVMSFSVFEHLAMPWKVVLEINKVMAVGGIGYIQTHQSFPLHEVPWDFWRFSQSAWPALFNAATGFRIIEVGSAEPLVMVAKRWHKVVNYGPAEGFALSAVLFEKVSESSLAWDVDLSTVAEQDYPA
jgi:hypothetical protein